MAIAITICLLHGALFMMLGRVAKESAFALKQNSSSSDLILIDIPPNTIVHARRTNHQAQNTAPSGQARTTPVLKLNHPKPLPTSPLKEHDEKTSASSLSPSGSNAGKRLDLDAMKDTARAIAHELTVRQFPGADKKLSGAEKFEQSMGRATRGDCRIEHAHWGLLAIPLLLKDAVTDRGCKW